MILVTLALEATIILLLILINGALSMSEMAIVSSRKGRLQQLADKGDAGAKTALELAAAPSDFLASVQIGITLIGILTGAFGGATIAREVAKGLEGIPALASFSGPISLGLVVLIVTLLSLILGELVPKRIALSHADRLARFFSRPLRILALVTRPIVRVLSYLTERVVAVLGLRTTEEAPVTEEDFKSMIEQGAAAGILEKEESSMMKRALAFGDRRVADIMTPRHQLVLLDVEAPLEDIVEKVRHAPHSYFPVYEGTPDHLIGVVSAKKILEGVLLRRSFEIDLRTSLTEPLFVLERMSTLNLLDRFKTTGTHHALVVDEYGVTAGIVTLTDLMEAIVGDLPIDEETPVVAREDGSYLLEGSMPLYELVEILNLSNVEEELASDFQTIGGLSMHMLRNIPRTGEIFEWHGYRFEIVDMDGRRVDKVLVSALPHGEDLSPV